MIIDSALKPAAEPIAYYAKQIMEKAVRIT